MALRKYRPMTPGTRGMVLINRDDLHKGKPFKPLTVGLHKNGGRNNLGRITTRHRGGGHKRRYRMVDFKRQRFDVPAQVLRIEYDPNRTAFIALIRYEDGEHSYILAPAKLQVGATVVSGSKVDVQPGNAMPLAHIPLGSLVHNIELKPGKGGQIARSAGSYAQLAGRDQGYALLKLSSGEMRAVRSDCMATLGTVSNSDHMNQNFGKAGRTRWKGIRPTVRGVVMNPVDHPHGGGEGKTSGGRHPVTPWGVPTKGKKTRHNKATDQYIVRSRHKAKKRRK